MIQKDKRSILIVDDQEINREILSVILKEDYNIIDASNGKEALDIVMEMGKAISLILLDIVMPVMNGMEFLKRIQTEPDLHEIPVIFVTTETYMENILNGLRMGVRDVIAKPYDAPLIRNRVNNLIQITEGRMDTSRKTPKNRFHCPTILIVEDSEINRDMLRDALKDTYNTLEAANGRLGLRQIKDHSDEIEAVLLDINMPVMDGIEMMREVQRLQLLKGKPVIAVTAEDSLDRLEEIRDLGICEIIGKPYSSSIIKNRVENMIELCSQKSENESRPQENLFPEGNLW